MRKLQCLNCAILIFAVSMLIVGTGYATVDDGITCDVAYERDPGGGALGFTVNWSDDMADWFRWDISSQPGKFKLDFDNASNYQIMITIWYGTSCSDLSYAMTTDGQTALYYVPANTYDHRTFVCIPAGNYVYVNVSASSTAGNNNQLYNHNGYFYANPARPASAPTVFPDPATAGQNYTVSWDAISGADYYELQEHGSIGWQTVYSGPNTSFIRSNPQGEYWYRVRACDDDCGCSEWSQDLILDVEGCDPPATPASAPVVSPDPATADQDYTVGWDAIPGADYYELEEHNGSVWEIVYTGSNTSTTRNNPEGEYWYHARACSDECGCSFWSQEVILAVQEAGGTNPGSSGNLSWDDWYEEGGNIVIIEPKYNGVMLNSNPATYEQFCLELGLQFVEAERTWYSGIPGVNDPHYDPSYGYNFGTWEVHPCSYDSWRWDDCSNWPSKFVATAGGGPGGEGNLLFLRLGDPYGASGWTQAGVTWNHSTEIQEWEAAGYSIDARDVSVTTITYELLADYDIVRFEARSGSDIITDAEGAALYNWVQAGGRLLASVIWQEQVPLVSRFGISEIDESCNSAGWGWCYGGAPIWISPVSGPGGTVDNFACAVMERPVLAPGTQLTVDGTISGYPAIVHGEFGAGKVVVVFAMQWAISKVASGDVYRSTIHQGDNLQFLQNVITYFGGGPADAPIISLISPDGSYNWTVGELVGISWELTGGPVTNIVISLSYDGGSNWHTISEILYVGIDEEPWIVTGNTSDNCIVKVQAIGPGGSSDDVSPVFSVLPEPYAELQISDILFDPDPPSADGYNNLTIKLLNTGNSKFIGKRLRFQINVVDIKGQGPHDSFWLLVSDWGVQQIRQDRTFEQAIPDIEPGNTELVHYSFKFKVPDYSNRFELMITAADPDEMVDDKLDRLYRSWPLDEVEFGSEAGWNCLNETVLAIQMSPLGRTPVGQVAECGAAVIEMGHRYAGLPDILDVEDDNFEILQQGFELGEVDKIINGGKDAVSTAIGFHLSMIEIEQLVSTGSIDLPDGCTIESGQPNVVEIFVGLLESAWDELVNFRGCGAFVAHHTLQLVSLMRGNLEEFSDVKYSSDVLGDYNPSWVIVSCPIDMYLTNSFGDTNSVEHGVVSIGIPESKTSSYLDSVCVSLFPGNDQYTIDIVPYEDGTVNIYTGGTAVVSTPGAASGAFRGTGFGGLSLSDGGEPAYNVFQVYEGIQVAVGDTITLASQGGPIPIFSAVIIHGQTVAPVEEDTVYYSLSTLDTGSVSGLITANSTGLHGVPVDLYDSAGAIVASATTDESGWYQFAGLDNGTYSVSISTPLGYQADEETKEVEVKGLPHEVNFELTQLEIVPQLRSRGYWAHQLHRALKNKPKDYTLGDFSNFAGLINIHFNQNQINPVDFYSVPQPADQADSLAILKKLLHMRNTGEWEPFLKRLAKSQLMALMLNVVSGKVSQTHEISTDGRTISQAITYCDMLVNDEFDPPDDGGPGHGSPWCRYIRASFILVFTNLGITVPSGMIPEDVIQIAYRIHNPENLPESFALHQNYPNPFNPTTEISFTLPNAADVKLEIFNIMGQRVTTLVNRHLEAGTHNVTWDGSDVASGVYLYRLQAGDMVDTKKMVLLK